MMGCGCNKNKGGNDKTPKASKANKNIRGTQILNAFKQKQFEDKAIVEKMRNQLKFSTPENVPERFKAIHREKMQAAQRGDTRQYKDVLKREQEMKEVGRINLDEDHRKIGRPLSSRQLRLREHNP